METNSTEYFHHLQVRVLSGLLNPNGENPTSILNDFHKNVTPETFVDPLFSELCRAAKDLFKRTGDCDPVVLISEISTKQAQFRHPDVQAGISVVFEAVDAHSVNSVTLSRYLPILNKAALAKYLPIAQKELEKAVKAGTSYEEAYAKFVAPVVERYKYKAHNRFDVSKEVEDVRQKVEGFKNSELKLDRVVPTGFTAVDLAMRGGMRPSQLIIIGARPATGKTTMALNFVTNIIDSTDKHVVFVSLEQTSDQLVEKIVSIKARCLFPKTARELKIANMRGGIERLEEASKTFPFDRIHIIEKTENVDTLSLTVKELCQKHNVAAVVVDYLQLIPSAAGERSRYESITKISNKLKVLAKDIGAPVVCLAQLSRGTDNEKRNPRLADLRDSGAIEQDADIGILLYNDMNATDEEIAISNSRTVHFDIQKNRNGGLHNVKMRFFPSESRFQENQQATN